MGLRMLTLGILRPATRDAKKQQGYNARAKKVYMLFAQPTLSEPWVS